MPNLTNLETSFFWIDDNREGIVVGTQDELREEFNLVAVLLFGFNLVVESRTEVLQSFGVLTFVQHHLIHDNQELGRAQSSLNLLPKSSLVLNVTLS